MTRNTKVCLTCSCGGHLMEIMQLIPFLKGCDSYLVTEYNTAFETLLVDKRHYYLKQQDRKGILSLLTIVMNVFCSVFVLLKERPTIIISTGAGAAIPTCILGKIMGARLIFIESFAKVEQTSMTGRIMHRFADYFFVQWESDLKVYPKAKFVGALY